MDNATNALIMAGEILIAILVLTLIVTVNVLFGSFSRSVNDQIAQSKDAAFNAHFYSYLNRANISASEIASIINFAKITNDENGYNRIDPTDSDKNKSAPYYINVYINNVSFFYADKSSDDFIRNNSDYENNSSFKDKVNKFINDKKQDVFSCNVTELKVIKKGTASYNSKYIKDGKDMYPDKNYGVVELKCNSGNNVDVSIIDKNHKNAKQDTNIRVVAIHFKTIDEYDITTSNEYAYVIQ